MNAFCLATLTWVVLLQEPVGSDHTCQRVQVLSHRQCTSALFLPLTDSVVEELPIADLSSRPDFRPSTCGSAPFREQNSRSGLLMCCCFPLARPEMIPIYAHTLSVASSSPLLGSVVFLPVPNCTAAGVSFSLHPCCSTLFCVVGLGVCVGNAQWFCFRGASTPSSLQESGTRPT